ncbi:MAG: ATP-binding protein [Thermosipho sp. (in: Bacteria)]|nr:ATP-binding protein [Thermosipho sp. (in: thermotogales)]
MKPSSSTYKRPSFFRRLFWEFPQRLVLDMYQRDPDEFREYGLHLFCGEQGSGKTTAVVHKLMELKAKYPKCKIRTNMDYKYEDGKIQHWKDLVQCENGIYGQIEVLDEIQTWFSSLQSKNFPPEMLTEISQQRKQRKMLIGTAQVFSRVAKPIREQTSFVYLPMTLFGCLTVVRISKPQYWDDENQVFKRYIGTYFFVHNEKIRNAFDTYKKIEKYKEEGFQVPVWRQESA